MPNTSLKQKLFFASLIFTILSGLMPPAPAKEQLSVFRAITFPVLGFTSYSDDFADPRSGGRSHEGNDIFGKKMQPLVAAVDGVITNVNYPEETWGYSVTIRDSDGFRYMYIHMNNDTPGTDDGKGDGMNAYAPNIAPGNKVVKGQLIGYMGDSGNAETTPPHLHFEIHQPTGEAFNPYQSLQQAQKITAAVPAPKLDKEILPFDDFTGGARVAAGNFDADSSQEIVVSAGPTGGPLIRTFEQDGTPISAFYAYATTFRGGVNIASSDMNNDGKAEIITAPGLGGGPHIKILNADGTSVKEFMAYDPKFHGGVDVAAVVNGNTGVIATAPGPTGGPHIKLFDSTGLLSKEFFAYQGQFTVGVRISLGNVRTSSSAPEVVVLPASQGGPNLKTFNLDGTEQDNTFAGFEEWWRSGYDLAAVNGDVFISSGAGRRTSVRSANNFTNRFR